MKRHFTVLLGILMISFIVSACGGKAASSRGGGATSNTAFTVGGVVSGLTGTLVLQNNGGDDLPLNVSGPFIFSTTMAAGSSYDVTVRANLTGQTCLVSNGTGTVILSNVTNISVDCLKTGGLVTSFNAPNGFTVQNSAAGGNAADTGSAITIDAQGRILVTGSSVNSAGNADMVIWRFNANGVLDTTFNNSGFVEHNSAAGGNADDAGNAITIDSQGRILVAGSSVNSAGNADMVIWRFNANGTLDTTFNNSGFVVHNSAAGGNADDSGNAIAIDTQHRILVAGSSRNISGNTDMVIWRFNANGTFDTGFDGDGIVVQNNSAGGNADDTGNAIAIDAQGKILVAGSSANAAGNADMVLWRFNANGTLDASFNGSGIVVHNSAAGGNADDNGKSIAIDSQGRILVTGAAETAQAIPTW